MSDTRQKLEEAKYFFKYNLSAFLSAARSVTLIMQKEFGKVSDFKDWYTEKQSMMRSDETMRLLNNKRVMLK